MTKQTLINGGIVVAAILAGAALSIRPWQVYAEQRALADQQIGQMQKSEKSYEDLVRQEARARSKVGKEEMARERGLLPQGEVPAPKIDPPGVTPPTSD